MRPVNPYVMVIEISKSAKMFPIVSVNDSRKVTGITRRAVNDVNRLCCFCTTDRKTLSHMLMVRINGSAISMATMAMGIALFGGMAANTFGHSIF